MDEFDFRAIVTIVLVLIATFCLGMGAMKCLPAYKCGMAKARVMNAMADKSDFKNDKLLALLS